MVSGRGPMKAIPASSTFLANPWFSERKPYLTSCIQLDREPKSSEIESCSPRVDHIDSVLQSDPDDIILSQISCHGSESLSNLISLISLLPVSTHLILDRVDGYGLHGQFVCGSEDSDGDLSSVRDQDLFKGSSMSCLFLSQRLDAGYT
jgi:hypothetical protein